MPHGHMMQQYRFFGGLVSDVFTSMCGVVRGPVLGLSNEHSIPSHCLKLSPHEWVCNHQWYFSSEFPLVAQRSKTRGEFWLKVLVFGQNGAKQGGILTKGGFWLEMPLIAYYANSLKNPPTVPFPCYPNMWVTKRLHFITCLYIMSRTAEWKPCFVLLRTAHQCVKTIVHSKRISWRNSAFRKVRFEFWLKKITVMSRNPPHYFRTENLFCCHGQFALRRLMVSVYDYY